eukprot:360137-Chlamydomonas_euryale.AAC.7
MRSGSYNPPLNTGIYRRWVRAPSARRACARGRAPGGGGRQSAHASRWTLQRRLQHLRREKIRAFVRRQCGAARATLPDEPDGQHSCSYVGLFVSARRTSASGPAMRMHTCVYWRVRPLNAPWMTTSAVPNTAVASRPDTLACHARPRARPGVETARPPRQVADLVGSEGRPPQRVRASSTHACTRAGPDLCMAACVRERDGHGDDLLRVGAVANVAHLRTATAAAASRPSSRRDPQAALRKHREWVAVVRWHARSPPMALQLRPLPLLPLLLLLLLLEGCCVWGAAGVDSGREELLIGWRGERPAASPFDTEALWDPLNLNASQPDNVPLPASRSWVELIRCACCCMRACTHACMHACMRSSAMAQKKSEAQRCGPPGVRERLLIMPWVLSHGCVRLASTASN